MTAVTWAVMQGIRQYPKENPMESTISDIMRATKYEMPPAMLATSRGLAPSVRSTAMRPHDTANRVVRIPLRSKKYPGLFAIVDEADADLVSGFTWSVRAGRNTYYAVTSVGGRKNRSTITMHRMILAYEAGDPDIDHADRNGLNNTRANLRPCTNSQNQANRSPASGGLSRYRGVAWSSKSNKWYAHTKYQGEALFLGSYASEEMAAKVWDAAARDLWGDFADLNFPDVVDEHAISEWHRTKNNSKHSSRYRGITWSDAVGKWKVVTSSGTSRCYVGIADDEIAAARMHDVAAVALYGEGTRINFPERAISDREIRAWLDVKESRRKSSKYRGVGWDKNKNKWESRIRVKGKLHLLGRFDFEEDAARTYDRAARKMHGDKAKLNFPEEAE